MVELTNKKDSCECLLLGSFQGFLGKKKQIMVRGMVRKYSPGGIIDVKRNSSSKTGLVLRRSLRLVFLFLNKKKKST